MRTVIARGLLCGALIAALGGASGGARANSLPRVFDVEQDCAELVPESYSLNGVTDDGASVRLDIALLVDRVPAERARELVARAASAYSPLDVDLRVASLRRVSIKPDAAATATQRASIDGGRLLEQAKRFVGGQRPAHIDVVHVVTSKDVTLPGYGRTPIGVAECVGGVRYDDRAFSASEDGPDVYSLDAAGLSNFRDAPAKAVAHELGHLLGAHHHYKSCVEGVDPSDVTAGEPSPCTVMSDVVDVASLRFGLLEAAVVRGHALDYARP